TLYDQFAKRAHGRIATSTMKAFEQLATDVHLGCPGINTTRLNAIMMQWLATTPTLERNMRVWRTRYNLGRMIGYSGHIRQARNLVERAWVESNYDNGVGILLFQLNGSLGNVEACRNILIRLEQDY